MQQFSLFTQEVTGPKPPLKWAGGKRWLLPHLAPIWKNHKGYRLVEPFVGGMAVTLGLRPHSALLNDINPHLINFYCWLQRGLIIENTELRNDSDIYYANRQRFNALIEGGKASSSEAAGLFYYLNRTGYNGLCRFNSRGLFNVPFGKYKTINYTHDFTGYQHALTRWEFRTGDFESLIVGANDFIYADPPYDVEFTSYSAGGFSWEDQIRLAKWLAVHDGPVVVSNQATRRVLDLYRDYGFTIPRPLDAPRMISCNGDRTPAKEMLATRNI